jgi:hypothetical protein
MYCSADDVSTALGLSSFSSSTKPTLTQVNTIITLITSEIDTMLLSSGISTPITNADQLNCLKLKCISGSACRTGFTYFTNNNGVENTQPNYYCKEYQDFKDMLLKEKDTSIFTYGTSIDGKVSSNVIDGTYTETELEDDLIPKRY